ncbi:MAG: hypothetical protein ACTHQQ_03845 [Solirubrobacteraceae bacterium]
MLDLRIYRTSLLAVVVAAIVVAFALQGQPKPLGTTLVPDAFNGRSAYANMVDLARRYPHRLAGSAQDQALAGVISAHFRTDEFAVSRRPFEAATPAGPRRLENVVAVRQGMVNPAIVVVAHRDALGSPARAEQSGTSVLLELGRVLSGETLGHTIVLVSTTGSTGTAGAAQLAASLGRPVDAVLVLGDMAGTHLTRPLVVPWSDGQQLAPALLRNTVTSALRSGAGLTAGTPSLAAELVHLAFPLAFTEQGPLNAHGMPAVLLSASGEKSPAANEPVSRRNIERFGRTTLQIVDALDSNVRIPASSAYITLAGKRIPAWAVRLLVLALIRPVAATALDGLARARRWGYAVARPLAWVGASAGPFLAALAVVLVSKAAWLSGVAPPGPVGRGTVPLRTGDAVLLAVLVAVIAAGFWLLWARGGIRALGGRAPTRGNGSGIARDDDGRQPRREARAGRQRGAQTVGDPGAAAAILISSCVLALVVWGANPFAALLLVPALHVWMVALSPKPAIRPGVRVALLALGFVLPALVVVYYAVTLGFGPIDLAWAGVLMLAGGQIGILEAVLLCLLMGCGVSAAVNAVGTSWASARVRPIPPDTTTITVRGPAKYARPGSLGDTASARRRRQSSLRR